MIKIILDIELANRVEAANELDHVAKLISEGYESGEGWAITGEDEKSDKDFVAGGEESIDEHDDEFIFNKI